MRKIIFIALAFFTLSCKDKKDSPRPEHQYLGESWEFYRYQRGEIDTKSAPYASTPVHIIFYEEIAEIKYRDKYIYETNNYKITNSMLSFSKWKSGKELELTMEVDTAYLVLKTEKFTFLRKPQR